jgi:putative oxidoreductase
MNAETRYFTALGRLLIAAIFIISGLGKIATPDMTQAYIASMGLPVPMLGYLLAILVEVGGGSLLVVGFQTRIVAFVLTLFTVATAVIFHRDFADQNTMIHFLKNVAIAGGLLQVVAFGAGAFSIDSGRVKSQMVSAPA